MADLSEPEVLAAARSFPDSQVLLEGAGHQLLSGLWACGWYGPDVSRWRGAFALIKRGGALEDLIGDRLKLRSGDRSVNVYAVASADLANDIHITRRAFQDVSLLAVDRIDVIIEVMTG